MEETTYQKIWQDPKRIRQFLDDRMKEHPELFPQAMQQLGYQLDGMESESSKMPGIALRRIRIPGTNNVYFLRPCPSPASLYDPFGWIDLVMLQPDWVI